MRLGRQQPHLDRPTTPVLGLDQLALRTRPGQPRCQALHRFPDRLRHPVVDGEHLGVRAVGVGVQQASRVGAAKGVHRLIRVAGQHELGGRVAEPPDQPVLLRVQVLRVIHEHVAHAFLLGCQQPRIRIERQQRRADQFRGVQRRGLRPAGSAQQRDLLVLPGEPACRDPLRTVVPPPQGDQSLGPHTTFGGPQKQIAQFLGEAGHGQRRAQRFRPVPGTGLDVTGQQVPHQRILVRAVEQLRGRQLVAHRLQPQHGEGVGVHRPHQRLGRGAQLLRTIGEQSGDLGAHPGRGAPTRGQHQDVLRRHPLVSDAVGGQLRDQCALAGTRSAEEPQEAVAVRQRPLPGGVPDPRPSGGLRSANEDRRGRGWHASMEPRDGDKVAQGSLIAPAQPGTSRNP